MYSAQLQLDRLRIKAHCKIGITFISKDCPFDAQVSSTPTYSNCIKMWERHHFCTPSMPSKILQFARTEDLHTQYSSTQLIGTFAKILDF